MRDERVTHRLDRSVGRYRLLDMLAGEAQRIEGGTELHLEIRPIEGMQFGYGAWRIEIIAQGLEH